MQAELEVPDLDDLLRGLSDTEADADWLLLLADGDARGRRKQRNAEIARVHRVRKKMELTELREQAAALTRRLHALRAQALALRHHDKLPAPYADEIRAQLTKRRLSERTNEQLRRMLAAQRGFVLEMSTALLTRQPPAFGLELDMRAMLHTYTRLGRRPETRHRDFLAACSSDKLDLATRLVLRETEWLSASASTPTLRAQQIPARHDEFAMTATSVYAIASLDILSVFRVARNTILGCPYPWPEYSLASVDMRLLESPASHIQYIAPLIEYRYSGNDAALVNESLWLEGRSLSYFQVSDACAALMWDFVDHDDLHPLHSATRLRCDMVGAMVIRREMCEDGLERAVCRTLCTKIHAGASNAEDVSRFSQQRLRGAEQNNAWILEQILAGIL